MMLPGRAAVVPRMSVKLIGVPFSNVRRLREPFQSVSHGLLFMAGKPGERGDRLADGADREVADGLKIRSAPADDAHRPSLASGSHAERQPITRSAAARGRSVTPTAPPDTAGL